MIVALDPMGLLLRLITVGLSGTNSGAFRGAAHRQQVDGVSRIACAATSDFALAATFFGPRHCPLGRLGRREKSPAPPLEGGWLGAQKGAGPCASVTASHGPTNSGTLCIVPGIQKKMLTPWGVRNRTPNQSRLQIHVGCGWRRGKEFKKI